jgi:predicted DsbA family dithiol-disulfide isomerase
MSQKKLEVIVYSDYVCPFCYIGYHRIEKLKEQYDLDIEWKPFELHPETPKEGYPIEKLPFPPAAFEAFRANVKKLADEDGLTIKSGGIMSNSRLALYISEFARKKGLFDQFHEIIMKKYWIEGKNIGDLSLLLDLAESIGLNRDEILKFIETDEPAKILKAAMAELQNYMINGVPTFIIGDSKIVIGAQPYEYFERVINKVLEEKAMASETAE